MTTPQDPGAHPDPTGSPAWSLEKSGAAPAADPAAAQGQWYQDPSGQWWYQDPTGQWYQDPRHAEQSAPTQYDQGAQYPPADQSQPWAGYPQQPAQDQSTYGSYQTQPGYGQPAYGQQYPATYQSYPGYPSYGTGFGPTPQTSNRRPGVVIASSVLWFITAAVLLGVGFPLTVYFGTASDADLISDLDLGSGDDPDDFRTGFMTLGIVGMVLGVVLAILAIFVLRGQNWARVTVTVVGALAALTLLISLVGWLLPVVAIVLQFLPAANTWFRSRPGAS